MVVKFYKVVTNTEFANIKTTAARRNTGLGSCELLVTTFLSTDQYTALFFVCLCLKTPYFMCNVNSLALNSQPAATISHV